MSGLLKGRDSRRRHTAGGGVPAIDAPAPEHAPVADAELADLFAPCRGFACLLVAVSGGADSMALLHLLQRWSNMRHADAAGTDAAPRLIVATVDHGLRTAAAAEAQWVGAQAEALGLGHVTLAWTDPKPAAGLQAAARAARYRLLSEEASRTGSAAIVLAHTRDDQAETLLMRLARGSGVDGLAAMRIETRRAGACLLRPLLDMPKSRLVATLEAGGLPWIEDPSNADRRFERVRLREIRSTFDGAGLSDLHLSTSARRLARARQALESWCRTFLVSHAHLHEGAYCRIDRPAFAALPDEIALRVLQRVLWAYGGQIAAPRMAGLEALLADLQGLRTAATLGGCHLEVTADGLIVTREPGRQGLAAMPIDSGRPVVWDRRFRLTITGECTQRWTVRPLARDGLRAVEQVIDAAPRSGTQFARAALAKVPMRARLSLPSVWSGPQLLAVAALQLESDATERAILPAQRSCHWLFDGAARLGIAALGDATVADRK